MIREQKILRFINKEMRGIEIAPYHSPLAPKSQGFNCLTLDVFDDERLLENARKDPNVLDKIDRIEHVDIVSSATDLDLAIEARGEIGSFDYVISSHNFEHLPNPIQFLRACGKVLKPGGLLTMAIPNKRFTFDYSRALSSFTNVYRAFHENHTQPDPWTLFDFSANFANDVGQSPAVQSAPKYANSLTEKFEELKARLERPPEPYEDAHVWVFTPESFVSIITDCTILKLIPLTLVHLEPADFEFYVHFRNSGIFPDNEAKKLEARRNDSPARSFRN